MILFGTLFGIHADVFIELQKKLHNIQYVYIRLNILQHVQNTPNYKRNNLLVLFLLGAENQKFKQYFVNLVYVGVFKQAQQKFVQLFSHWN